MWIFLFILCFSCSSPIQELPKGRFESRTQEKTIDLSLPLPCPITNPDESDLGPIIWDTYNGNERWMFLENAISKVLNSKQRPVEVCGVKGELRYLVNLVCPDGKKPFKDMKSAHSARAGSVGPGGRCGKIIDLYIVPCSDKEYHIYMDMYHCTADESFM